MLFTKYRNLRLSNLKKCLQYYKYIYGYFDVKLMTWNFLLNIQKLIIFKTVDP